MKEKTPQLKTLSFDKPKEIVENYPFVKYILDTLDEKQALLIKGQGIDPVVMYEKVRLVLNRILKGI